MKSIKRNIVVITVLMFVCAAVYLNWSYNKGRKAESSDALIQEASLPSASQGETQNTGLYYQDEVQSADDYSVSNEDDYYGNYFATARLSRQQARDNAISILQETAGYEGASQNVIDDALGEISVMAAYTMTESQIENILLAKGFTECVVFMGDDSVNVIVPAPYEGLSSASVARITDTVTTESGVSADRIKIIEVK